MRSIGQSLQNIARFKESPSALCNCRVKSLLSHVTLLTSNFQTCRPKRQFKQSWFATDRRGNSSDGSHWQYVIQACSRFVRNAGGSRTHFDRVAAGCLAIWLQRFVVRRCDGHISVLVSKSSRRDWSHQKWPDLRQHRLNRRPLPHGQGSLRPSFSSSCLSPWTIRNPHLT